MGFRDKLKKKREELDKKHREETERKDETHAFSSIYIKDKFPDWLQFWRPKLGEHLVDILPWEVGTQHPTDPPGSISYQIILWVYTRIGIMGDNFVSPVKMFRETDPIFEYIQKNRPLPKKVWNELRAKQKDIYLIYCRDSEEEEKKGPQLWEVAHWFVGSHLKVLAKKPKGGGAINYSDIEHGMSLAFDIQSEGKFRDDEGNVIGDSLSYIGHRFTPRPSIIPDLVVDKLEGLHVDELIKMTPSYEEIYESFYGKPFDGKEESGQPTKMGYTRENICPHGGAMGTDYGQLPNCDECSVWDTCKMKNEEFKQDDPPWEEPTNEETPGEETQVEESPVTEKQEEKSEPDTPPPPRTRIIKKKIKR